jgi:hypothetical protein
MFQKTERHIQLIRDSLVDVADRSAAVGAETPNDTPRFRKRLWTALNEPKLVGTVTNPHDDGAPDGPAAIIIMIVTSPERIAAHFRDDCPTEAKAAVSPLAHTNLPWCIICRKNGATFLSYNLGKELPAVIN